MSSAVAIDVERSFTIVCGICGSSASRFSNPADPANSTIQCGHCNADRGTLDQLKTLARAADLEFSSMA